MNRYVLSGIGILLLVVSVWFMLGILSPSSDLTDLTPEERRGYPQAETADSSSSTASSTAVSCGNLTIYDCPVDRWQIYRHEAGFEFKYPLTENLKSTGDEVRIDLGYPQAMRFKLTLLDQGLSEATLALEGNDLYRRFGGDRRALTISGRRALTVSDAENAGPGWLTYIELDSGRVISLFAEFTEDFESDLRLYGQILSTLTFGASTP